MPISVTNIGTNAGASGATIAVTVPGGGVPSGTLICVAIQEVTNTASNGTVADTAGNTYTMAVRKSNSSAVNGYAAIYYAYNATALSSGNSITFTRVSSGASTAISALYATGIQTGSDPLDSAALASANGTASTSPSVTSGTPSVAGDLFVAALGINGGRTFTQDSGNGWAIPFNEASSTAQINGGNLVNAGSGTKTFNPTLSSAQDYSALIAAFKSASGRPRSFGTII